MGSSSWSQANPQHLSPRPPFFSFLSPAASSTFKPFLCFIVPSFHKHTLKITWTPVVKSFLHEVENPHTTSGLRQTCSKPRPRLATEGPQEADFRGLCWHLGSTMVATRHREAEMRTADKHVPTFLLSGLLAPSRGWEGGRDTAGVQSTAARCPSAIPGTCQLKTQESRARG